LEDDQVVEENLEEPEGILYTNVNAEDWVKEYNKVK